MCESTIAATEAGDNGAPPVSNNDDDDNELTTTASARTTTTTATIHSSSAPPSSSSSSSSSSRKSYFRRHLTPPELMQNMMVVDPHTAKIIWRDFWFLVLGCVALSIVSYVETHAADPGARVSVKVAGLVNTRPLAINPSGIVDTGYILTQPLYEWLEHHRDWNDLFAALNSVVLMIPSLFLAYVTIWKGDYSLSFRVLAVQLLRAFCGWFTYLPPDPTYLNSYYDFPDIVHCLFQDCGGTGNGGNQTAPTVIPFVSFFSGHVATMVVAGNHMWLTGHARMAIMVHFFNVLQILRLLATRGHYSIDIIIGWYVAVYVSNPAGRLGRYYSRGFQVQEMLPKTPTEAFEHMTGVADARNESRMAALLKRKDVQELLLAMQNDNNNDNNTTNGDWDDDFQSETTARILQETTTAILQERAKVMQQHMQYLQKQGHEKMNYMKQQGQERMTYLQQQAQAVVARSRSNSTASSASGGSTGSNANATTAAAVVVQQEIKNKDL